MTVTRIIKNYDEIIRDYLKESSILQLGNILIHGSLSEDVGTEVKEDRIEL
ncbi:hypothetical protein J5U23_01696 [Saccharolobus shibatae B12]|uniref:Uncharacterized protein n=2 Tax=Saccharolobus shibatae TaxID=2286 RepID=A0A8F5BP30_SACSH|nr:hypothetical protein [Saccharolobus shibatae]QXJ28827.1 hypothetical protein J5U23_01696 [Saccharolobus shibatae B12]QXJ35123.1 hypothetical protein J5U22_01670 [Saccharolobus shibatae]